MTTRLDWGVVQRIGATPLEELTPRQAAQLVDTLGWLSPLWLRPEVLLRAARRQPAYGLYSARPALPTRPGGCWAVLVQPQPLELLRPAFLLPLCWRPEEPDDPHLPVSLAELAGLVRQQLRVDGENPGWGLSLARPAVEEGRDLSGLGDNLFGAGSAWASLAGGLLLGRDGLTPSDRVWASAAWDETYGVGRVDGLEAKLDLAEEWGVEQLFAPAQNQPEASAWRERKGERPAVGLLLPASGEPSVSRVLEPYLEVLGVEPGPAASTEVCQRYHARVSIGKAEAFYWARLMRRDIERCRREVPPECRCTHLVTVVSETPSVVAMAPAVQGVGRCLLLHLGKLQGSIKSTLAQVKVWLEDETIQGRKVECSVACLEGESFLEQRRSAREKVQAFAQGAPASELAFDLTPGYKTLTLALEAAAPQGAWLLYCRHKQKDKRPVPGTQVYDRWRKEV
jgi:hypothetical protein